MAKPVRSWRSEAYIISSIKGRSKSKGGEVSTNSTLKVLTPKGLTTFLFSAPIVWDGVFVHYICMSKHRYYIGHEEDVPSEILTNSICSSYTAMTETEITRGTFLQLFRIYLPYYEGGL